MKIVPVIFAICSAANSLFALPLPTSATDFFMAGSQPRQSGKLEISNDCVDCHGNYNPAVEPMFLWQGSMMAHSARDPLFYAGLTIANQDAKGSGDMCIRCHAPKAWLEGRSSPSDASAFIPDDRDGITCTVCHYMIKPFPPQTNPYPRDSLYTAVTYLYDDAYQKLLEFIPVRPGSGQYVINADGSIRRGPYSDAKPTHEALYSPYHRESNLCGTCHDVSNPLYTKNSVGQYLPNLHDYAAPLKDFDPYMMFPVERTYSEWTQSEFNSQEGVYAPQFGGNKSVVRTCQDCHMSTATGKGCKQCGNVRDDLAGHDLTGGNTVVPKWVASLFPDEVNHEAIEAGIVRAEKLLKQAATVHLETQPYENNLLAKVRVINETGHKLPTGYGEGRRMWINLRAYDAANLLIFESGAYDSSEAELHKDAAVKIYEIHHGITPATALQDSLKDGPSFHFVLNDTTYFDNRIPPRGFSYEKFKSVQSEPVGYFYHDGQFWDDSYYYIPAQTARVEASLFYQTISKEYVEFLCNENHTNDWGNIVHGLWETHGKSAPVLMNKQSVILPRQFADLSICEACVEDNHYRLKLRWNAEQNPAAKYHIFRAKSLEGNEAVEVGITENTEYELTVSLPVEKNFYYILAEN